MVECILGHEESGIDRSEHRDSVIDRLSLRLIYGNWIGRNDDGAAEYIGAGPSSGGGIYFEHTGKYETKK